MSDAAQALLWTFILIFGVLFCLALSKAGVAATYVRDLLHVGAGSWVFGLPYWTCCCTAQAGTLPGTVAWI